MAKKRRILLISLLCASTALALAQDTEDTPKPAIPWASSYAEGMATAKAQKRPALIKFSAEWCKWCERMDVEVFVDDPVIQAADWATRQLRNQEPTYGGVPGATNGTFLWALKNIPIVTMGAGDRQIPHQVDEWVDLDQLVETAKIYALTALHYLFPPSA